MIGNGAGKHTKRATQKLQTTQNNGHGAMSWIRLVLKLRRVTQILAITGDFANPLNPNQSHLQSL
jgi:hypothetical protein